MRKDEVKYEIVVKKPQGFSVEAEEQHLRSVFAVGEREVVSVEIIERKPREVMPK